MYFKVNYDHALIILNVILSEYMSSSVYFFKADPEDTIGMTTPVELKELYNSLLIQFRKYS